jgi:hypothetical protein
MKKYRANTDEFLRFVRKCTVIFRRNASEVDLVSVKSIFLKLVDHEMHCSCLSPEAKQCLVSEKST